MSELLKKNWQNIEKNFDTSQMINTSFEKKVNATLLETSLHNFLVINKWMQIK